MKVLQYILFGLGVLALLLFVLFAILGIEMVSIIVLYTIAGISILSIAIFTIYYFVEYFIKRKSGKVEDILEEI